MPNDIEEPHGRAPVASEIYPGVSRRARAGVGPVGSGAVAAAVDVLEPAVMVGDAADQHRRGVGAADVAAVGQALEQTPRILTT
jgi:hypothetical protein